MGTILFLLLIGGLVYYINSQAESFSVQRSITINATPEKILGFLEDFHKWTVWSPWEKMETNVEKKYSGAEKGVGAIYEWNGNKTGAGRMEIVESSTKKMSLKLDFTKPMQANNMTDFLLEPTEKATVVTWIMSGKNNFIAKAIHLVMPMDKMVGGDFEKGLSDLKMAAESN